MEQYIKANLLRADLVEIDKEFSKNSPLKDMSNMLLIKHAFLTIANFVDFELTVRGLYKEHNELSQSYKEFSKEYEFAKYLRNKFVGHIKPELIEKSIEWRPELRYSLQRVDEDKVMFIFNIFILETAINTYVDSNGNHKLFDYRDTDLMYPPDLKEFMIFLTNIIRSAIKYLTDLSLILKKDIEILDPEKQNIKHWIAAGNTEFKFIKK